ncbi:preprotein translocase subunit SecG [bacterium]|nr:preprotein translocase subunit SecG [bacterium]
MLYILVLVLLVIVSICLVGVVLLQSGKGNNLTNAFESEATFGNRSGDVLTKSTMVLAVSFIVLCLLATILYKHGTSSVFKTVNAPARQAESNMRSMAQQEADEAAAAAAAAAAEEAPAAAEATPEETKDAAPAEAAAEKTAE